MATNSVVPEISGSSFINRIVKSDCIDVMRRLPAESVDFILTDPPYLVNFRDRTGRKLQNDTTDGWLTPAFAEAYRVLKQNQFMLCFYGWPRAHRFIEAWTQTGFRAVGHLVFVKRYSSKKRFLKYQHEQAYLLAKGHPPVPEHAISDVQRLEYTGNALHPTQKSVMSLLPLVQAFSQPGDLILDCFCGSASSCGAALLTGRRFIGIELDAEYARIATERMERIRQKMLAKSSATRFPPAGDYARVSARLKMRCGSA
jgi:DNA modification methylase